MGGAYDGVWSRYSLLRATGVHFLELLEDQTECASGMLAHHSVTLGFLIKLSLSLGNGHPCCSGGQVGCSIIEEDLGALESREIFNFTRIH